MFLYCPSKPALTEPNGKVHFPRLAIKTDGKTKSASSAASLSEGQRAASVHYCKDPLKIKRVGRVSSHTPAQ